MRSIRWFLLLVVLAQVQAGCSEPDDPLSCFDLLWHDFDWRYGQFEVKHIDWDDIRERHRVRLSRSSTDNELFDVLSEMLAELNDSHIHLYGSGRHFRSGILGQLGTMADFSLEVVREHYLAEPRSTAAGTITFGNVSETIGYIHLSTMGSDGLGNSKEVIVDGFDLAMAELAGSAGLIVDVRGNQGGPLQVSTAIAGRFADKRRLALQTRWRVGPQHSDFGSPTPWYVSPAGQPQFSGPVVLLTNRFTNSAAELFTLMMRLFPNVIHLGDLTSGAQDGPILRELPNGWFYMLPLGLTTDSAGNCYEGIGITPEILVTNSASSIEQGIDKVLETATAFLR